MKTVWVVSHWVPEEDIIDEVFATEELAREWVHLQKFYKVFDIEEHEVHESLP